jgi:hypothetical protein
MPENHDTVAAWSGRDKEPEADDPMLGVMVSLPGGDPKLMARCIIEEYAMLGLSEEELFKLFSEPYYQTHRVYRAYGEAWVRELIEDVLRRTGRMNVSVMVHHHEGGCDGESV